MSLINLPLQDFSLEILSPNHQYLRGDNATNIGIFSVLHVPKFLQWMEKLFW